MFVTLPVTVDERLTSSFNRVPNSGTHAARKAENEVAPTLARPWASSGQSSCWSSCIRSPLIETNPATPASLGYVKGAPDRWTDQTDAPSTANLQKLVDLQGVQAEC